MLEKFRVSYHTLLVSGVPWGKPGVIEFDTEIEALKWLQGFSKKEHEARLFRVTEEEIDWRKFKRIKD